MKDGGIYNVFIHMVRVEGRVNVIQFLWHSGTDILESVKRTMGNPEYNGRILESITIDLIKGAS